MKKVFIINPVSAKEKLDHAVSSIKKQSYFNSYEDEILFSEYAGHVTELAAAHPDCEIYSVGGDGTFLEAVNGVLNTGCPVCFMPMGSGNDFIRTVSNVNTFDGVAEGLSGAYKKIIDLGIIDDDCFANIASVGFDAEIVKNAQKFKNIPLIRKFSYILSIFYTLCTYKGVSLKMTIDGNVIEGDFLLVAVANGRYYGGGIEIAPTAKVDDGFFDVIYAPAMSKLKVLTILPRLLNGSHLQHKLVKRVEATHVIMESDTEFLRNTDGDLKPAKYTDITIKHNGLTVILPKEKQ
ncbi:MAG: YegS/Rv2252/BmrU family lipid kinase [Clostridia bacterium]|nr:YegS/Rv2252/BmrU family lipid kinase [Clostridia bacterium]